MQDTPRARALGKELRAVREAAGLSMRQLGDKLGWSEAKVSRLETARRGLTSESVAAVLETLPVGELDRDRLLQMAKALDQPAWWELGRELPSQLTTLVDAEQRAVRITNVLLNVVPGLLQTRAYTRRIMDASGVAPEDLDDHVSIRQVRQGILSKRDPVDFRPFIDEAALMRPVGGARVMAEQLHQVVSTAESDNVRVRVLPLELGAHAGITGNFMLMEFVKARPLVFLEGRSSGAFIDDPEHVGVFFDAIEALREQASDVSASQEILRKYLRQYESEL